MLHGKYWRSLGIIPDIVTRPINSGKGRCITQSLWRGAECIGMLSSMDVDCRPFIMSVCQALRLRCQEIQQAPASCGGHWLVFGDYDIDVAGGGINLLRVKSASYYQQHGAEKEALWFMLKPLWPDMV